MSSIDIREAQPEDAAAITRLIRELAADDGIASPIDEAYARHYLSQSNYVVLLARLDGKAVGLLSYLLKADLYHAGDTCYISELVVTQGYRSQGIGSALMHAVLRKAEDLGCAEISVSSMQDNSGAIKFYKRHGFEAEAVFLEKHFS